jgi:hypothetical protein
MKVAAKYGGGSQEFWMFDVGGQRGERRKWLPVMVRFVSNTNLFYSVQQFITVLLSTALRKHSVWELVGSCGTEDMVQEHFLFFDIFNMYWRN